MNEVNIPPGQLISDKSFVVDYVASETGRLVKKVILDQNTEIDYTGELNNKGLRTVLVFNDVRPPVDTDLMRMTANISVKTEQQVRLTFIGETDVLINWGDGYVQQVTGDGTVQVKHTYQEKTIFALSIKGKAEVMKVSSAAIVLVDSFGTLGLSKATFSDCMNLLRIPKELPESFVDLSYMFSNCDRLDVGNVTHWDLGNVSTLEGFLAMTVNKKLILEQQDMPFLENIDRLFFNAENCTLELVDCHAQKLDRMNSVFEGAVLPNFYINRSSFPALKSINNLFFEATTNVEQRGKFTLVYSYLGMEDIDNLIHSATGIDVDIHDVEFTDALYIKNIVASCTDAEININNLTLNDATVVENVVSDIRSNSQYERSSIHVGKNLLAKVTNFYHLVNNLSDCDVTLDFSEYSKAPTITALNDMLHKLTDCSVSLNQLNVDTLSLEGVVTESDKLTLDIPMTVSGNITIEKLFKDCGKVALNLDGCVFNGNVAYGPLAPGATELVFNESNVTYANKATYIKPMHGHELVEYIATNNKYAGDVYIDSLICQSDIDEVQANNWDIEGSLTVICLMNKTLLKNQFKEINFNGWDVKGHLNTRTLMNYIEQPEGFDVSWLKSCVASKVSIRGWVLHNSAILESAFNDIQGINLLDMEGWRIGGDADLRRTFYNSSASINMKRWTFVRHVNMLLTFSENQGFNKTIELDSCIFYAGATFQKTFEGSAINVSLLSIKLHGATSFISTFQYFGNDLIPFGKEITISGLGSLKLTNVVLVDKFMADFALRATVAGTEGLMTWVLPQTTEIIDPFLGTTLSFPNPF